MDTFFNSFFQIGSFAPLAFGGILGTYVGYRRLQDHPKRTNVIMTDEHGTIVPSKTHTAVSSIADYFRSIGILGYNSVYGMVVYPMIPTLALPYVIARDTTCKGENKEEKDNTKSDA